MNSIKIWLATALMQLHKGTFLVKLYGSFKLAIPLSLGAYLAERLSNWTVTNSDYIASVLVCIAVDHIIGTIYHLRQRDFTIKKNCIGLMTKITLCAGAAIMFEVIQSAVREVPFVYEYLKTVVRLMVILYPAGSAFMNMSALTNGVFPPLGWMKRIKYFNENLDLDRFKKPGETDDNQKTE